MAIKLLMIEDEENVGRSGEVVNVKPGFARNYLLPRGIAVVANKGALRMQARLQEERAKKAIVDKQESEALASTLQDVSLVSVVKVDQEGHMYGSVSASDIIELLKAHSDAALERRNILLKHPIKQTGNYTVGIKLKEGVATSVKLRVVPEGTDLTEEAVAPEAAAPAAEESQEG